ncbi:hypothetical protein GCM10009734_92870 [Nonomuraea bangladeshensis]
MRTPPRRPTGPNAIRFIVIYLLVQGAAIAAALIAVSLIK